FSDVRFPFRVEVAAWRSALPGDARAEANSLPAGAASANDMNNAASRCTIAQDLQTLNTHFAALERAEQRFADDGHDDQHHQDAAAARHNPVVEHARALDVVFADVDGHLWDRV